MKRYYQMEVAGSEADIDIYGDITSWPWVESDVTAARSPRAWLSTMP